MNIIIIIIIIIIIRFISVLPPMMLNYRIGFTPQALFTKSLDHKSFTETFHEGLLTLLSIPNVIRGLSLLLTGGLVLIYLVYLWIEARRIGRADNVKNNIISQQLNRVIRLQGNGQVILIITI